MNRREFLAASAAATLLAAEEKPVSNLPIVDTHQHLWDLSKFKLPWVEKGTPLARNFVMSDYLEATRGLNVVKTVYMEVDPRDPLNAGIVPRATQIACVAAFLCVAGLAFALWARATLGRNWSGVVTLKEGHELVQCGPYQFVRHPIYTGVLIMSFATALIESRLAGFVGVLLMFASFWIKLDREERLMLKQFPERYAAYKQRVKRLIPFVL